MALAGALGSGQSYDWRGFFRAVIAVVADLLVEHFGELDGVSLPGMGRRRSVLGAILGL